MQDPMHPEYGVLMAPHLNAQVHQHFFQVRLDMACDDDNGGKGLVVSEVRCSQHRGIGGCGVLGRKSLLVACLQKPCARGAPPSVYMVSSSCALEVRAVLLVLISPQLPREYGSNSRRLNV